MDTHQRTSAPTAVLLGQAPRHALDALGEGMRLSEDELARALGTALGSTRR